MSHTAQYCLGKSINLAIVEDEANINYIKEKFRKMKKSLLNP